MLKRAEAVIRLMLFMSFLCRRSLMLRFSPLPPIRYRAGVAASPFSPIACLNYARFLSPVFRPRAFSPPRHAADTTPPFRCLRAAHHVAAALPFYFSLLLDAFAKILPPADAADSAATFAFRRCPKSDAGSRYCSSLPPLTPFNPLRQICRFR
jgi:hypothetical protein